MRALVFLSLCTGAVWADASQPLTIAAAIETTRLVEDGNGRIMFPSPSGRRYAMVSIRGDVSRDGVVATLMVGELSDFERTRAPEKVAELFTRALPDARSGFRLSSVLGYSANIPQWMDDSHLALLWEDEQGVAQVVSIDADSGEQRLVTRHPTSVIAFGAVDPQTVVYSARFTQGDSASAAMLETGFAVQNPDVMGLLRGNAAERSGWHLSERFVITAAQPQARKIAIAGSDLTRYDGATTFGPVFSSDGRRAIVTDTLDTIPRHWRNYRFGPKWVEDVAAHPNGSLAARAIHRFYVIDVASGTGRALWDAPTRDWGGFSVVWSPDDSSVLIGPTVLPLPVNDDAALSGSAVAEVDVATGRYLRLPVPRDLAVTLREARWLSNGLVELISNQGTVHRYAKHQGVWRSEPGPVRAQTSAAPAAVRIELRQDANVPPALYKVDPVSGRAQLLLDLNPQLQDYALGRVEMVHWRAPDGQPWTGRLYYPVGYHPGRRYPLVIQTYGFEPASVFSLYGKSPGLGPGSATRIAQPLASRGVMVLQLGGPDAQRPGPATHRAESMAAHAMQADGRISGAEYLVERGMVERTRVGIEGFSQMGRHVEHTIAFSDFPFAAAIASDYSNDNYIFSVLFGKSAASFPGQMPFGAAGMKQFLESSPAFNAERIRTPLQIVTNGPDLPALLDNWEMFAQLRHLRKPVELYVAPKVQQGSHMLQNPGQVLAVQQRGLDWWCFWLKDEEDEAPAKAEQYRQWRALRALRDADAEKPRPPLLEWIATPRQESPRRRH